MSAAKKTDYLTLDEAIALADSFFQNDADRFGHIYKKGTLYNQISAGKLKRYGPHHRAHLERGEFLAWLESKKKN